MAYDISSPYKSLKIAGYEAIYAGGSHGVGGLLLVDYTKGAEDGTRIYVSYLPKGLDVVAYYNHVSMDAATRELINTYFTLTGTGKYRIPIMWTAEDKNVKFTFESTGGVPSGTIFVEFREAE